MLGASCSTVDTFQLMLVEDLMEPNYPYLKILEGLMLGVQCLLSEVPLFFVAGEWAGGCYEIVVNKENKM